MQKIAWALLLVNNCFPSRRCLTPVNFYHQMLVPFGVVSFAAGGGGWVRSHFPAHMFCKYHFSVLKSHSWSRLKGFKNIYPIPILTFFSHSQCSNPSPSALNLVFPGQIKGQSQLPFYPFRTLSKSSSQMNSCLSSLPLNHLYFSRIQSFSNHLPW